MVLTRKQEEGLKIALERYKHGEKYTCISGYAGTGKSTLIKFIIAAMNLKEEDVRYIAYTGKAANVLKNKGCPGATTAHKLLYYAKLMPNGKYFFKPKTPGEMMSEGIKIVVVDEISMLPKTIWNLLCSHSFYILACGDPEQLPPVPDESGEDPNNHVLDHPHVFLDEIMRQAQESEIIRLSMHIREGKPLLTFPAAEEQVKIIQKKDLTVPMFMWADQILCATNRTKNAINQQIREVKGFDLNHPQVGDKIINLHNEWNIMSNHNNPLTNGVIGTIKEIETQEWYYPFWLRNEPLSVPIITATFSGDEQDEEFTMLSFDEQEFLTGTPSLNGKEEYKIKKRIEMPIPLHANFGYAITVWKAQGSEWNKVLLFQETGWPKDINERRKYMYTGITRAVDRLVVVGN